MYRYCSIGTLDEKLVKGKIVMCDWLVDGEGALSAGAIGSIMQADFFRDTAYNFPIPSSYLNYKDGGEIVSYIKSDRYTFFRTSNFKFHSKSRLPRHI